MTNFFFLRSNPLSLISNYQYYPAKNLMDENKAEKGGKISKMEILYGNFENIDANILFARETDDINYLISYNRFKIDSYAVQNKKILNSAFGYDYLKSGVNFLLAKDYFINFDFDYRYKNNGLQGNTNYNNQIKSDLLFSPQIEYSLSEKSSLKFSFQYSALSLGLESFKNSLKNEYSFFQSKITYKTIWSSRTYVLLEFFSVLDALKLDKTVNNQYAYFNILDKLAVSDRFSIEANLKVNLNKNYPSKFSGGLGMLFAFKNIKLQTGYNYEYNYHYYYNIINENNFYKFFSGNIPYLNHKVYINTFVSLLDSLTYGLNISYNHTDNYPELREDDDFMYFLSPINNIEYLSIMQEILLNLTEHMDISLNYQVKPYANPGKVSNLAKNLVFLNFELNYSIIKSGLNLKYYDLKYYIDNRNNYSMINSGLFMDIYAKFYFTKTFGFIFKIKNLTDKKIVFTPRYPETENVFNAGVIAEF